MRILNYLVNRVHSVDVRNVWHCLQIRNQLVLLRNEVMRQILFHVVSLDDFLVSFKLVQWYLYLRHICDPSPWQPGHLPELPLRCSGHLLQLCHIIPPHGLYRVNTPQNLYQLLISLVNLSTFFRQKVIILRFLLRFRINFLQIIIKRLNGLKSLLA